MFRHDVMVAKFNLVMLFHMIDQIDHSQRIDDAIINQVVIIIKTFRRPAFKVLLKQVFAEILRYVHDGFKV